MDRRVSVKVELHLTLDIEEGNEVCEVIQDLEFDARDGLGNGEGLSYQVIELSVESHEVLDSR
jgi:hypothetical protein